MERLTIRREQPLVMSMWCGDSESLRIYNKLAQYEDAEEEGRLVVLPCKAGDSIYPINIDRELNKPPLRVTGFRFSGFDNEGWIEIGLLKYKVSEIGKTVFLTREEAEQALNGESP